MAAAAPEPAEPEAVTDERGERIYSEGGSRRARRTRRLYSLSSILTGIGFAGLAVIVLILTLVTLNFPIYVQALGALFAGGLLYWSFLGFKDFSRVRKALRPLRVYENGIRLPCGTEDDIAHGLPPRFIKFADIAAFYPNEGDIDLPYFAIILKDSRASPYIVPKDLVSKWGSFKKSVKDRMEVHTSWHFIQDEGPAYVGKVRSDDLSFVFGAEHKRRDIFWDDVADAPKLSRKLLKNFVVMKIALRAGGKMKFLMSPAEADVINKNYRKYSERFWKAPEKEEMRWEGLDEAEKEKEEKDKQEKEKEEAQEKSEA